MKNMKKPDIKARTMDLSEYSESPPATPLRFLFIHHSCGGELLAAPGPANGINCINISHPNGGGLRALLENNSYEVHEASYCSKLGEHTDIFDWRPKFQNEMDQILECDVQDTPRKDGLRNNIVAFKSCFPNNQFKSEGAPPGNPAGPELTVWNAKAAYRALLDEFRQHPEILFVCVTAPPLASQARPQPLWKRMAKKILGRASRLDAGGPLARQFNNWLADTNGWLKDYPLKNVVVFDYYDVLTGHGASDFCLYPTGDGYDSHPSSEGNRLAAGAFVPFLNRAVRRAGLEQLKIENVNLNATFQRAA